MTALLACGSMSARPIAFRSNGRDHVVGPQASRHLAMQLVPLCVTGMITACVVSCAVETG